jgi:metal-responsive CopG/Arc/MetJ family transcriptional regulator
MKTAISIPEDIFALAEGLAQRLGISRSELYTRAVKKFVAENRHARITEELNKVYETESSSVSPELLEAQSRSIPEEDW